MNAILPPAMLGILGGGQLGYMFVLAAKTMGYRVTVLDPDPDAPAARFADYHLCAPYTDPQALDYLADHCAAVTVEFENVSTDAMRCLAQSVRVVPSATCVAIAQDRIAEKTWINHAGALTAPWRALTEASGIDSEVAEYLPGVLKTARLGYDGKGQVWVDSLDEVRSAWQTLNHAPCVLEKRLDLKCEISVIVVRTAADEVAIFPIAENCHIGGILNMSIVPAAIPFVLADEAQRIATQLVRALEYVGVLAVEFFVLNDDSLLVNEIAPRPHNSGHYTLDACVTDQFQQQVRALCALPPGSTKLLSPSVMVNLLGELWPEDGSQPNWRVVMERANVQLHLYGKTTARAGRKMGHFTVLSADVASAIEQARDIQKRLGCPDGG